MQGLNAIFLVLAIKVSVIAQSDSLRLLKKQLILIEAGACGTVDLYNNRDVKAFNTTLPAGVKDVYYGPALACYKIWLSSNQGFQTGIEYSNVKYFVLSTDYYHNYRDVLFNIQDFAFPAYYTLMPFKQRLILSVGPKLHILPYSVASGFTMNHSFSDKTGLVRVVDLSASAKIGGVFQVAGRNFIIEGRFSHGLSNLIPYQLLLSFATLHNDQFALTLGYVLQKK